MTKEMVIISFGRTLLIITRALITAYGLESILIPNNVSDGRVTGISIVGPTLFGLPLGISIGITNLPFVQLGYKQTGREFVIFSVVDILSLSIFTSIIYHIPTIIEGNSLLIIVVGRVVIGSGVGLTLRNGGTLDGTDMLAILLSRRLPFRTSNLILLLNTFVFIFVPTVFGFKGAVLSAPAYFITSKVTHIIEEGLSGSKTFKITTKDYGIMNKEIKERLGRYYTLTKVTIDEESNPLVGVSCVINKLEEQELKEIINDVDPDAFIAIYDTVEVKAGNMKKSDIY